MANLREEQTITKAYKVKHRVSKKHSIDVDNQQIRKIFRDALGMKYKRIKKIPFQGNSEQNLVLRQQFGMKLIE